MVRIFRHKDLEDYFKAIDYRDSGERAKLVELYEAGKVIALSNVKIECDNAFLASLSFPQTDAFKKFKSVTFLKEYAAGRGDAFGLKDVFERDQGKYRYFIEQMKSVNAQIDTICKTLFPRYRSLKAPITWRVTETVNENVHVDVYNEDLPDHHLRLFVNIDVVPRIWHTSYSLEYMLANFLNKLDPAFVRTATAGRICHDLNFAVFGGFDVAGREGHLKHIAFFDPNEIWLVDSRKIAHQIFYGRQAISTDYQIDVASMNDPSKHYYALVERYRAPR